MLQCYSSKRQVYTHVKAFAGQTPPVTEYKRSMFGSILDLTSASESYRTREREGERKNREREREPGEECKEHDEET